MMRKEKRFYKRQLRWYRRALHRVVNKWHPYDYDYIVEVLGTMFAAMLDYYVQGNCVVSNRDEEWEQTRFDIIANLLRLKEHDTEEMFKYLAENYHYLWD